MVKSAIQILVSSFFIIVWGVSLDISKVEATTVLSKPVSEYTVEASFVGRILVTSFEFSEIQGFPHRKVHFVLREVFKGRGETGESASFTIPGGPVAGSSKVVTVGGGMTSFVPGEEYIIFLKDMPSFSSGEDVQREEIPNVLVGWTALQVVYENGERGLRQAGTIGQIHSARTLSDQKMIRHANGERTRAYGAVVDEIAGAASQ
jgi:hypothetical protein